MSFRNVTTGKSHSFGGKYLEIVPGKSGRYMHRFGDPSLPGEINVTTTIKQVTVGTALNRTARIPDRMPLLACYLDWQEALRSLAKFVEPDINP